mmetsp:Transcript_115386/g.337379  ORF Transcript_115386/g.337379 Transcript_115386/m.337379 type:complete len:1110 (+) Transcript_115386:55-3384(+)
MSWLSRLLLVLHVLRSAVGVIRNYTCLANASVSPSERRNVTINGVSQYLKIGAPLWDSATLEAWIFRIIAEDLLGINTEGPVAFTSSTQTFDGTADCQAHVSLGTWETSQFLDNVKAFKQFSADRAPVALGSLGYSGLEGFFVKEESLAPAMQQDHLVLSNYVTYSRQNVDFMQYFDSAWTISDDRLQPCSQSTQSVESYLTATGDQAGISTSTGPDGTIYRPSCINDRWWVSPQCRSNHSSCIPTILDAAGFARYEWMMHRAYFWNLPVAVATAIDTPTYKQLPSEYKLIWYGFLPSATFATMNTTRIFFPRYDARLWQRGIYDTEIQESAISKWMCKELEGRGSEGTSQLVQTLRNMQMGYDVIEDAVKRLTTYSQNDPSRYEEAACQWLKDRVYPWEDWVALSTACVDRQGLVSQNGTFVGVRDAEAKECKWCSPGRKSIRLSDTFGTTYACERCATGKFQRSGGATACEQCQPGEAAPGTGREACERCPRGRYGTVSGLAECDACPPAFSTAFQGATSVENCICPEGLFRSMHARDTCSECMVGMTCPTGSDELGYVPEHAAEHPTVPLLKEGFWASAEDPMQVYACESLFRCPGGRPGESCAGRLEGQGCSTCEDGHYWTGERCRPCSANAVRNYVMPIFSIILLPAVVSVLYYYSGDDYGSWGLWYHGLSSTFYLLLDHYQVASVVKATNLQHPQYLHEFFGAVGFLSHAVSLIRPECNGMKSSFIQLAIQSVGPALVLGIFLGTWAGSQLVGCRYPSLKMQLNRTMEGFLSILLVFFAAITGSAFTVFKCGINPNGTYSMLMDRGITCYEGDWNGMAVVGAWAVLVWCLGLGALFARAVWRAPKYLHDDTVQRWWRFLFIRYRPDVHWWGLVFVCKNFLLNLGSTLIISAIGQIYWIIASLLLYTYLSVFFRPWRHLLNCSYDVWVNLCLLFTCLVVIWSSVEPSLDADWGDSIGQQILTASFFVLVCLPLLPLGALMLYRQSTAAAQTKKELNMERIFSSVLRVSTLKREECFSFLQALHERDFRLMLEAMYLIQTELAQNKCRIGYSANELRRRNISVYSEADDPRLTAAGSSTHTTPSRVSFAPGSRTSQGSNADRVYV